MAFARGAFTREGICEGPSEAPSEVSSLPHTYTHKHILVFLPTDMEALY